MLAAGIYDLRVLGCCDGCIKRVLGCFVVALGLLCMIYDCSFVEVTVCF